MKFLIRQILICSLGLLSLAAGPFPWMGVSLEDASEEVRVGTEVAAGTGLQVRRISENGPFSKAGGKTDDLWWKFEGQILVSKRQLMILLGAKKAGDEVVVDFYREGILRSMTLTLGEREGRWGRKSCDHQSEGRKVLLTKREQEASFIKEGHHISLRPEEGEWRFVVTKDKKMVLDVVSENQNITQKIPPVWLDSFMILRLSLEGQNDQEKEQIDKSERRVRYFPRPKGDPTSDSSESEAR